MPKVFLVQIDWIYIISPAKKPDVHIIQMDSTDTVVTSMVFFISISGFVKCHLSFPVTLYIYFIKLSNKFKILLTLAPN